MPEHTIAENLTRLQNATTAIGNAITAKGGTVTSGDGLEDFASDIGAIPSGGVEFSNSPQSFDLIKNISNLHVTIPSGVTSIVNFTNCVGLLSIDIPDTVLSIGNYAFYGCTGLTNVVLPDSINSLGSSVFAGCSDLQYITLSKNITQLNNETFYGCSNLKHLDIPNKINSISNDFLRNCQSLQYIKFEQTTPPTAYTNTFRGFPTTCEIYVPEGSLSAYTSAANYPDPNTYTYVEY